MCKCDVCGRPFAQGLCKYCDRIARWERKPVTQRLSMFPPRIQENLLNMWYHPPTIKDMRSAHSRFIFGPPGTGKTMYAARVAYELMCKNIGENNHWDEIRFTTMVDLLQELRQAFQPGSAVSEMEIIDRYRKAGFLIIDDFAAEKNTDWAYQIMYTVLNYRYEYCLPTIITSNYDLATIEQSLNDQRMTSRISEMCEQLFLDEVKRPTI